ncbi:MAG TPA: amino acid permease [Candidatus Limnocylindrales bacterium]|nr:amino acid permease [Candidatus Limnocylindrales bacterium]
MASDRHPLDRLEPALSLADATLLVVSSVIGVGIFLTPGQVAAALPSAGAFLAAWVLGGVLSLAGALANAELGAMYPHAGGDYVYLREAWHPLAGFVIGWLSFFVIYAGTVATLAVGFVDGLAHFVPMSAGVRTAFAVAITLATSAIHFRGVRLAAWLNNVTAGLKIAALAALAVIGPMFLHLAGTATPAPAPSAVAPGGGITAMGFGLALSPVLFSYLGWNASVYVASEIRRPERNLPLSLFAGLAISTAIYLAVNLAYLDALSIDAMRANANVGEAAARVFFGEHGATIASVLILGSILSCLNATILVGPRIAYAMAIDGLFFRSVQGVHERYRTPHIAIAVQAMTAIALIVLLRRFPSVLDYTTFAIVLATIADTAALYQLRRRHPHRPRPYRAWGYPLVPALYLVANAAIAIAMLIGRPIECAAALAVTATALPAYAFFVRQK